MNRPAFTAPLTMHVLAHKPSSFPLSFAGISRDPCKQKARQIRTGGREKGSGGDPRAPGTAPPRRPLLPPHLRNHCPPPLHPSRASGADPLTQHSPTRTLARHRALSGASSAQGREGERERGRESEKEREIKQSAGRTRLFGTKSSLLAK